jgi:diguanylate cyclase (GGDEF)-like protein
MSEDRATVLIVDDEPQNLHLLGEALREECELLVATSGPEALRRACSDIPPDLILLDIMMPEMDGYEVCRTLKGDPASQSIPVIFITARDAVNDEAEGLAVGAVDYITKPFSPEIVRARVRTHLRLKAQADMLASLSVVDELTGLPNRRQFERSLENEWRRARRNGDAFTIVMLDVDHFKQYNDNYGHSAGDECLRRVASALGSVMQRPAELVARYGGEEFVALLPGTNHDDGLRIGERFRARIEALCLEHAYSPAGPCVTVSAGVATGRPCQQSNAQELLEATDRMLYRAKHEGRNRVSGMQLK